MNGAVAELEPVDTERCQCETKKYNPFVMGGRCTTVTRCIHSPTTVVTEKEPDENGQMGAMSLCTGCLVIFVGQQGNEMNKFVLQEVPYWKDDQARGLVKLG